MLKLTGASVKAKAILAAAALLCVITPCLTISCSHPYTCTLEDIGKSPKVDNQVLEDIRELNKSMSDKIRLILSCDRAFSKDETKHLGQLGIEIDESWIPPVLPDFPLGMYTARCKVENICEVANLDIVKEIGSGEVHARPMSIQQ
jgi:hypothetical protein